MTPREHAHAQNLQYAHFLFGPHEADDVTWRQAREAWIAARENVPGRSASTKTTTDITTGETTR